MNLKDMATSVGLEEAEYLHVLRLFVDVTRIDLDRLESAASEGYSPSVAEAAHSLKGGAVICGFREICELVVSIEKNARMHMLEGVSELLLILREKVDEIDLALSRESTSSEGGEDLCVVITD